jgi:pilus assembly protein CpaF
MELHERISNGRPGNGALTVDPFADVKNRIHLGVIEDLGRQIFNSEIDRDALKVRVTAEIATRLAQESAIAREDRTLLASEIADDILGHGPLEKLLADDSVTEIMVNGPFDIWIERRGKLIPTSVRFSDDSHLRRIINKMVAEVGRRIDESVPMVDARLPDGSRVNAVIPPLSLSGPLVTIRKFSKERWDLNDLVRMESLSLETVDFLQRCVEAELNILVSGGTGTGKTTLLNALSTAIPDGDRIITIEDSAELRLNQRHVLRMECRPSNVEGEGEVDIRDLVRNSLRMRPDRIIVGEVRGAEALDMLQAMNTGHDGSLCTAHANSARDALSRIETMVLMAGYDLPLRAIRQQVCSALDLIVHLERLMDGSRRVTTITEVQRMESDVIGLQPLFEFKVDSVTDSRKVVGSLRATGLRPTFLDKFEKRDVKLPIGLFQAGPGHGALGQVAPLPSRVAHPR